VKRRRPAVVRRAARLGGLALAIVIVTLTSIQFGRIIGQNIALKNSLVSVQRDVRSLKARDRYDQRQVRRLSDPNGSVPEIHERLHLVRPNETIIYLKPSRPRHVKE